MDDEPELEPEKIKEVLSPTSPHALEEIDSLQVDLGSNEKDDLSSTETRPKFVDNPHIFSMDEEVQTYSPSSIDSIVETQEFTYGKGENPSLYDHIQMNMTTGTPFNRKTRRKVEKVGSKIVKKAQREGKILAGRLTDDDIPRLRERCFK